MHTSRVKYPVALLSLLALLLLVLAACGDDDEGDEGLGEASPEATADTGDDGDDANGEGDSGSAIQEIQALAGEYEGATGVISYTFSSTEAGSAEGTWTLYSDAENSRVDVESEGSTFISITTPEATYLCTEAAGEGNCFAGEGAGLTNPFLPLFESYASSEAVFRYLDLFGEVDVDSSSEEVAGVDASCYTASGDFGTDSGSVEWCFSSSGLLLVSRYDLEGVTFEMRATEFSEDVPGDAFDPPYEVTQFGS